MPNDLFTGSQQDETVAVSHDEWSNLLSHPVSCILNYWIQEPFAMLLDRKTRKTDRETRALKLLDKVLSRGGLDTTSRIFNERTIKLIYPSTRK